MINLLLLIFNIKVGVRMLVSLRAFNQGRRKVNDYLLLTWVAQLKATSAIKTFRRDRRKTTVGKSAK